ncbi:hypothetical protein [Alteromonas ponticola]|uniref:DUF2884 family protein n=1 Tax=Alteromonas ponticola TaxID=2720613 RepID=A0ABX1QWY3_9ALTE|nr:hypothetical protein [Alteromonas ponticola]NMH58757.1 hypothetical protein [Alteromonas ponticola]
MMKLNKIAVVASVVAAFTTHLSLANNGEYHLIAYDDCNVVADQTLTQSQIEAYLALKDSEDRMQTISAPIHLIQGDIDNFTAQIGELTDRAIQDSGNELYIDKALLREQEALTKELESLIESHEADFAALEKEGRLIEERAKAFEKQIQPFLKGVNHDFVRIIGPDTGNEKYSCKDKNIAMFSL